MCRFAFALVATLAALCVAHAQTIPICEDESKYNLTLEAELLASALMSPHVVAVQIAVPIAELWAYLSVGDLPAWNPLFNTIGQPTEIQLCGPLTASYSNGAFLKSVLPVTPVSTQHSIVQLGCDPAGDTCGLGYFFTVYIQATSQLVVYGRHTYQLYDNGDGTTAVSSFEKVAGSAVGEYVDDWNASLQESLLDAVTGLLCLERMYQTTGGLASASVAANCAHFSP